ncbi:MAG: radical SAM protein [Crenarchaeota archaeon]|nr:radical SAM protein [Thermoproteota archaeon]
MRLVRKVEIVEENVVRKRLRRGVTRIAIAYPSTYMVGMSSLSIHLLYFLLNSFDDVYAERVFMEGEGPYRSVETGTPLKNFDVILFSVHYELDYVNVVRMLERSGINPLRDRRVSSRPLIIVGGPTVSANPEPVADIVDAVFLGEIEGSVEDLVEKLCTLKNIDDLADVEGIYVPSLGKYDVNVAKVMNLDSAPYPTRQIVTLEAPPEYTPIFGRAFFLEICRGCPFLCHFCVESHIQFPFRFRSYGKIVEILRSSLEDSHVDKVVILGLAAQSHPDFRKIITTLLEEFKVSVSLPSMRVDVLDRDDLELIVRTGQKVLTIAPETSERIRFNINKKFTDEDVVELCKIAKEVGMDHVKLYFIVGLPGETERDLDDCIRLVRKICDVFGRDNVYVSVNPWVRKPHVPLQYASPLNIEEVDRRLKYFLDQVKVRHSSYDVYLAYAQMLLSLGDREVCKIVLDAAKRDGNVLSRAFWKNVLKRCGEMFKKYVYKKYDVNDVKPWSHVHVGLSELNLWKRYLNYVNSIN